MLYEYKSTNTDAAAVDYLVDPPWRFAVALSEQRQRQAYTQQPPVTLPLVLRGFYFIYLFIYLCFYLFHFLRMRHSASRGNARRSERMSLLQALLLLLHINASQSKTQRKNVTQALVLGGLNMHPRNLLVNLCIKNVGFANIR